MRVLRNGSKVIVSIDTDTMPYKVLQIRGTVRTDMVDGIAPEYEAMTIATFGEEEAGVADPEWSNYVRGWRGCSSPRSGLRSWISRPGFRVPSRRRWNTPPGTDDGTAYGRRLNVRRDRLRQANTRSPRRTTGHPQRSDHPRPGG